MQDSITIGYKLSTNGNVVDRNMSKAEIITFNTIIHTDNTDAPYVIARCVYMDRQVAITFRAKKNYSLSTARDHLLLDMERNNILELDNTISMSLTMT